jgi:hypothetical protein
MPSRKTHDVVATVGEYESQGQKKKRYANVGSAFTNDEGQISIKLDTVPVSPDWSGWLSLYVPKEKDGGQTQQRQQSRPAPRRQQAPANDAPLTEGMEEDNIPF